MKRFRVISDMSSSSLFKANTTDEIYSWMFENFNDKVDELDGKTIECLEDEIEVSAKEFWLAFEEGECPGDLQFF